MFKKLNPQINEIDFGVTVVWQPKLTGGLSVEAIVMDIDDDCKWVEVAVEGRTYRIEAERFNPSYMYIN